NAKCRCNCECQVKCSNDSNQSLIGGTTMPPAGQSSRSYNGVPAGAPPGARWRKSGRSSAQGNCVELAKLSGSEYAIRNSRHPHGPALVFTEAEVDAFLAGVKDGDFDDLLA